MSPAFALLALPAVETLVATSTGPAGLAVVFVYSFLVAFALPGELVLVPAPAMRLGLPAEVNLGLVVVLSAAGKAIGSVAALRIGHEASHAGPVRRLTDCVPGLGTLREGPVLELVHRYGFAGMALLLAVPFTPDTATVYAFSVVESSTARFALAAFVGTVVRLLLALGLATGVLALL